MDFTVDRSRWIRGGVASAYLQDYYDGGRCCLGFVALQLGVPEACLQGKCRPDEILPDHISPVDGVLVNLFAGMASNSQLTLDAIMINDSFALTDDLRERKLAKLFSDHGHSITFTGEGRP